MSLINDALKQAKQAQQEATPPPAPNLQLRPVEAAQYTRNTGGLMWPAALLATALLLLVIVWQQGHRTAPSQPVELQARATSPAMAALAPPPVAPPHTAAPAPEPVSDPAPTPPTPLAPAPTNPPEVGAGPIIADPLDLAVARQATSNTPAAVEPPPPKPAPPRLQAIFFSPVRPSVMIKGKTLFVGDKLEDLRVTAIDRESVTLVGGGQTNVLRLAD